MINKDNVVNEIDLVIKNMFKDKRLVTGDFRKVSSLTFKKIENKELDNVLELCENLLEKRKWKYDIIAYDWAFKMKNHYEKNTFDIFENWLKKYVDDWGNCDDFCTHAFGELLAQYNEFFDRIVKWIDDKDFWVRRAAAVILIYPLRKKRLKNINPFIISNKLMNDDHYLVLKGYGWMLKELSTHLPERNINKTLYQSSIQGHF